jgi:cytoskeleton protein RodZ
VSLEVAHSPVLTAPVTIRRRVPLLACLALLTLSLAAAYFYRAWQAHGLLDGVIAVSLLALGLMHAALVIDGRLPLAIADDRGLRVRRLRTWQAIPWSEIVSLDYRPRGGLWRDGHLECSATNQRRFRVPVTLGTQVDGAASAFAGVPSIGATRWRAVRPAMATGIGQLATHLRLPEALRVGQRSGSAITVGSLALTLTPEPALSVTLPESDELRRPDDWEGTEATIVVPLAALEDRPAPVIGPELAKARDRLGLDIEELSSRTRITPRVIRGIEVDDFAPCGGDFYARGHLRTLSRVLGVDASPLVEAYDDLYADGPAGPRLLPTAADSFTGRQTPGPDAAHSNRATVVKGPTSGGPEGSRPNWTVLIAAVMAVVLLWSVARLVLDGPAPLPGVPGLGDGSGGVHQTTSTGGRSVPVVIRATGGGARVVVRDGNGRVIFTGDLAYGSSRSLTVVPPIHVETSDGSLEVVVGGDEQGRVGDIGRPASETYIAP